MQTAEALRAYFGRVTSMIPELLDVYKRQSLRRTLTEEQEDSIRAYIRDSAVDGKVMETTHTTRVTVIWRVDGK